MNYNNMLKFKKIVSIAFFLYIFVIYFIYQDNKNSEIYNEKINIQDVLIQTKAVRKYVSNDQKDEIYELQKKGIISYHYFTSPLLSSTYSANKVNEYYNEIKKSLNLPPIDIRFASPNPRNPNNMTTKEEKEILDQFISGKIDSYETIKKTKDGDVLYLALPTRKLEAKCMRCHDTPEIAPKQLVEMYGDTAGFGEKEGNIKAIMSIEKPLKVAYNKAFEQTLKSAIYILIATLIFVYFYYNFNKKIYIKNKQLEKLNKNLDTKVKERTTELNNSKIQLLNVINSSELGYWDWEINTKKLFVNDIWLNMIGIKKENFDNTISQWFDKIHPEDFQYVTTTIDDAFKKEISFSIEYRIKHSNNNYIWVECVGGVVQRDSQGKVIQACGIHRNIDEKKQNENKVKEQELLIQNQARVASMGEMLKNVSHQWKQPLSIITTVASTMKLSYEFNQPMKNKEIIEFSEKILENGNYLAKVVNDFASYFDNNIQKKEELNLSTTINKIVNMMKSEIDAIKYIDDVDEDLFIYINENFFTQALLNIINNSHDAFNINSIDERYRFVFINAKKEDSNIIINMKDTAGGIEENIINKIFEPYFTTKHQSLGTGIGLYMTNQIISKHLKGTITAKNSVYKFEGKQLKGCEFNIIIPS
ncbi:DUF3365 domain-containing protein [Halarcobacter sp.]|uniref:c-type heme family protein n=1 Tax=Halarcobacter sp. TaxID=2321133 RepID=UPI002AA78148|nr:DUF3365 domain-containing protein [Halarcobacter sp.]